MGVPNTDNFSFHDVKNEIENNGGATTNSLVEAFANANATGFDSSYEGSKDSLLNFRNYNHVMLGKLVLGSINDPNLSTSFRSVNNRFTINNSSVNGNVELRFTFISDNSDVSNNIVPLFEGNSMILNTPIVRNYVINPNPNGIDLIITDLTYQYNSNGGSGSVEILMEILSVTGNTMPTTTSVIIREFYTD
ncbi:hypothetical protein JL193_07200 [Polaribacter batillariae]|uniref:Uncharacterized protein n=1 Tax=Polaribacter batillariae TaxID=2808900 RepID=A0ABX7T1V4_9FLAO|nr:hypothetical protein [Polaribacter batillariae]QTD39028.1 hypothetical protein JL193_07200 [Polaribacter batillariae]